MCIRDRPRKVNVTLNLAHAPMGMNPVTLAPSSEQETSFVVHTSGAGLAEVHIYPEDAFAADNYALLELPAQRSLHVVVYSNSPEEWRPALESDPRINLVHRYGDGEIVIGAQLTPASFTADERALIPSGT